MHTYNECPNGEYVESEHVIVWKCHCLCGEDCQFKTSNMNKLEDILKEFDERFPPKDPADIGKDDRFHWFIRKTFNAGVEEGREGEKKAILDMVYEFGDEIEFEEMAQMMRRVVQHCKESARTSGDTI